MDGFLKRIWYSYEQEHPEETNSERRAATVRVARLAEELLAEFDDKQKRIFMEIGDLRGEILSLTAAECFEIGVKFATQFFIEAAKKL